MIPTYLAAALGLNALLIALAERSLRLSSGWRPRVTRWASDRRRWRPPGRWEQIAGPHRVTPGATGTA